MIGRSMVLAGSAVISLAFAAPSTVRADGNNPGQIVNHSNSWILCWRTEGYGWLPPHSATPQDEDWDFAEVNSLHAWFKVLDGGTMTILPGPNGDHPVFHSFYAISLSLPTAGSMGLDDPEDFAPQPNGRPGIGTMPRVIPLTGYIPPIQNPPVVLNGSPLPYTPGTHVFEDDPDPQDEAEFLQMLQADPEPPMFMQMFAPGPL